MSSICVSCHKVPCGCGEENYTGTGRPTAQDINRIRAEAVREHKRFHLNGNPWRVITEDEWDEYADKIKKGEL